MSHPTVHRRRSILLLAAVAILFLAPCALASAFVRGAHYRLGDADPAAAPGAIGNDPTRDSFTDALHLARSGSPRYAADVPANGPIDNKLSMAFANQGLGGPAFPGLYGRATALPTVDQGLALETWVQAGPTNLEAPAVRNELLAYNGDPATGGFGLFLHDTTYAVRLGPAFEKPLGPADVGAWHHLAYVYSLGTSSYYYDGKLVAQSDKDPAPTVAANEGFWLAGRSASSATTGAAPILYAFNGHLDEVRFQSFNPLAAGAFDPAQFLVTPEPAGPGVLVLAIAATGLCHRRRPARASGRH
jgi:hypothetical protein